MTYPWSDFRRSLNCVTSIGPWICHNALRHIHGMTLFPKGKNDTCLFFLRPYSWAFGSHAVWTNLCSHCLCGCPDMPPPLPGMGWGLLWNVCLSTFLVQLSDGEFGKTWHTLQNTILMPDEGRRQLQWISFQVNLKKWLLSLSFLHACCLHPLLLPTLCTYLIKNYHNSHLKPHTLKMSVMRN